MKKIKNILSIIFVTLIIGNIQAGGGWPKKKGAYYFKLATWWIESDEAFSVDGTKSGIVNGGLFNVNIFGEYGITDRLTVTAYIPFFSRSYQDELIENGITNENNPGDSFNSFGDSEIGLKYGLFRNDYLSWAASVTLGLPFGNDGTGPNNVLATGDGEFNQILRTDLGISLLNSDKLSLYANIYSGVNIRSEDFSEEYRGGAEFGAGFIKNKLWVITKFDVIESFDNGDRDFGSSATVFANNVQLYSLTPEVSYKFTEKIGISASVSIPLDGENIFSDPSYSAGVFIDVN